MKRMKLKRFLVLVILIIVTLISVNCFGSGNINGVKTDKENIELVDSSIKDSNIPLNPIQQQQTDIKNQLIAEVTNYMKKQSPAAHKSIPEHIVVKSLANNLDICFVMAQTEIETNYGTTGAGRSTSRRSLFGVCKKYYDSYESAIDGYIELLHKSYLVKGRTVYHLMKNYVTGGGARYAGNKKYEANLTTAYNKIKRSTNIYKLQKNYQTM